MTIKLTKQQQQILAGGVLGLGAFVYCYIQFFWLPVSRKMAQVGTEIESMSRDIESARHQAARLPDLEKQLVSLNERKIEAEKRLPRTKSVPDILVTLDALAGQSGAALMNFTPGSSKASTYFIELHFPVTIRGPFHSIGRFFAALALEQRLYNVSNVNYPEPAGAGEEMQVTFELISYQYKEG